MYLIDAANCEMFGIMLISVYKLTGVNVNLSIALCLYLDVKIAFKQISADQKTAIVLLFK